MRAIIKAFQRMYAPIRVTKNHPANQNPAINFTKRPPTSKWNNAAGVTNPNRNTGTQIIGLIGLVIFRSSISCYGISAVG